MKNCVVLQRCAPQWNLLIGFPGETSEVYTEKYVADIRRSFPTCRRRRAPSRSASTASAGVLHAGEGVRARPPIRSDFYGFIYPFGEEVMAQMIYYFVDHRYTSVTTWRR